MTELAPELVSPADAFLAAGAPSDAFLADNLPSVTEAEQAEDGNHTAVVIALAGAFIAWRWYVVHQARREPVPVEPTSALELLWRTRAPIWLKLARPAVEAALAGGGLSGAELQAVAADYAAGMGQYIHRTSADAVVAGFQEQIRRGTSPTLAWMRAIEGYGLTERRLRSWVAQQAAMDSSPVGDLITPGARRALDRALLLRADALGQHEAWHARHVAKSVVWMAADTAGQMPTGTRKRWLTAEDERVCAVCGPLHKQEVGLRERFRLPNGAELWAPGVHPNCRCELELVYPKIAFEKALGDDPYDRDSDGKFARQESRVRKVPRPQAQTREARVDPAVAAMFAQMTETAEKEAVDPWAEAADPWAQQQAGDPWADPWQAAAPAETDPWAPTEDPWAPAGDPWADAARTDAKTTGRVRRIFVLVNGQLKEVQAEEAAPDPDRYVYLPADHLYARMEAYKPSAPGEPAEVDKIYQRGDVVDLSQFLGQMAYEASEQHRTIPLGIEVFELRAGDPPGTLMHRLDDFYHSADDADDEDDRYHEAFYHAREAHYEQVTEDPDYHLGRLDDDDVRVIYFEAGLGDMARQTPLVSLWEGLRQAVTEGDAYSIGLGDVDSSMLRDAFVLHTEESDPELLELKDRIFESQPHFLRVPQVFSFPENEPLGYVDQGNGRKQPFIHGGQYRVKEVRMIPNSPRRDEIHGGHFNPRITALREVILERMDYDD